MIKISNIAFRDFRVFEGEVAFDFLNSDSKPSDFVCIYGQNGLGKSSFFDGVEWYTNGKINRLEDVSKIISTNGSILKNMYSQASTASVCVTFSNETRVTRTTTHGRKENIERDYYVGSLSPANDVYIDSDYILPNDKINSFISSFKPADRYKAWGGFTDENDGYQAIFKSVYLVKRKLELMHDNATKELEAKKNELSRLDIDDSVKDEINSYISEYNVLMAVDSSGISLIERSENGKLSIPDVAYIQDLKSVDIRAEEILKLKLEKLNNLQDMYVEYNKCSLELESDIRELNRIQQLVGQCKNKSQLILDVSKLQQEIVILKRKILDDFAETEHTQKSLLESATTELEDINLHENDYSSEINSISVAKIQLDNEKNGVDAEQIQTTDNKNKTSNEISIIRGCRIESDELSSLQFSPAAISYIESDSDLSEMHRQLLECNQKIILQTEQVEKCKRTYEAVKSDFDEISNAITSIMSNIKNNNLSKCPVCKTTFGDAAKLIGRFDLSAEQQQVSHAYDIYLKNSKLLEELKSAYKSCVDTWNQKCTTRTDELIVQYKFFCAQADGLNRQQAELAERDNVFLNQTNALIMKLNGLKSFSRELTAEGFNEWCNQLRVELSAQISSSRRNLDMIISVRAKMADENADIEKIISEAANIGLIDTATNNTVYSLLQAEKSATESILKLQNLESVQTEKCEMYEEFSDTIKLKIINIQKIVGFYQNMYSEVVGGQQIELAKIKALQDHTKILLDNYSNCIIVLDKILTRITISNYNERFDRLSQEYNDLNIQLDKYSAGLKIFQPLYDKMKTEIEQNIDIMFGSAFMNSIYKRIEPHKEFGNLKYEIKFDNDIPGLYIKGKNSNNNVDILPEFFYSTAQMNTVALSIFISKAISKKTSKVRTIFIDDPIASFDDINSLAFVDLIRTITEKGEWQIILTTHDESLYKLFQNKISSEYYNSRFIKFTARGRFEYDVLQV